MNQNWGNFLGESEGAPLGIPTVQESEWRKDHIGHACWLKLDTDMQQLRVTDFTYKYLAITDIQCTSINEI